VAVVGLHRAVVDHRPAPHRFDGESRVTVARLGHRTHEARVDLGGAPRSSGCRRRHPISSWAAYGWTIL
jgi:hypothetical protein